MTKYIVSLFIVGVLIMFFCNTNPMPSFDSFHNKTPQVDIQEYFNGTIKAWGILQDRSGEVTKRFDVIMEGSWNGDEGTLDETFDFDDGKHQKRKWFLKKVNDESFIGKASDVVGEAAGAQKGNAINMKYVLQIPVGDKTYDIAINDWLIQMDEKRMVNISALTKFGFNVGRLTIFFEKQ